MMNELLGYARVLTYLTTRNDEIYKYPAEGVMFGSSVSHIAMQMQFKYTPELESRITTLKDLAAKNKIPFLETINPQTKQKSYDLYFSYWPGSSPDGWDPNSKTSRLETYKFDTEQSAKYSPMSMDARLVHPDKRLVKSLIPFFSLFMRKTITLPPTITLHTTRLGSEFADKGVKLVENAAMQYAKSYEAWSDALLAQDNHKTGGIWNSLRLLFTGENKNYAKDAQDAENKMNEDKTMLKNLLYPGKNMSENEFALKMEPFITYGSPERDQVNLPVFASPKDADKPTPGLKLAPMLDKIIDIASNPEKYPYDVMTNNCANAVNNTLEAGAAGTKLENSIALPWYMKYLPLPPALVLQNAANGSQVVSEEQKQAVMMNTPEATANTVTTNNLTGNSLTKAFNIHARGYGGNMFLKPSESKTPQDNQDEEPAVTSNNKPSSLTTPLLTRPPTRLVPPGGED